MSDKVPIEIDKDTRYKLKAAVADNGFNSYDEYLRDHLGMPRKI